MSSLGRILAAVMTVSAFMTAVGADAQEIKHYRFAYDQPKTTGYGILGDIFADKLKALSKGTMLIDQYPDVYKRQATICSRPRAKRASSAWCSRPPTMRWAFIPGITGPGPT